MKNSKLGNYVARYEQEMCDGKQYIAWGNKSTTIHALSLFSPGARSEEQFQSVFKQDNKWYT